MTKEEFVAKHRHWTTMSDLYTYDNHSIDQKNKIFKEEIESDLNSVVESELHEFMDWFNQEYQSPMPVMGKDINRFLQETS